MKTITTNYLGEVCELARNLKLFRNDVLYCEGNVNYTHVHLISGKPKMLARTLLTVENRISSDSFVRISRKHLVNRKFITEIGVDYVVLRNDLILPISRRRRGSLWGGGVNDLKVLRCSVWFMNIRRSQMFTEPFIHFFIDIPIVFFKQFVQFIIHFF